MKKIHILKLFLITLFVAVIGFRYQILFKAHPFLGIILQSNIVGADAISQTGHPKSKVDFFSPNFSFRIVLHDASTIKFTEVKDNNSVIFVNWGECPDAIFDNVDAKTFTALIAQTTENPHSKGIRKYHYNSGYAADKDTVYYYLCDGVKKVEQADRQSFSVIDSYFAIQDYAKDNRFVYYRGVIIPGADSTTFTLNSVKNAKGFIELDIRDKNRKYDY